MDDRNISKNKFNFLKEELSYFESKAIIEKEEKEKILDSYKVGKELNFIKVFLIIGLVLIGLGILSFIASNWISISKLNKVMIIVILFILGTLISYVTNNKYPKISKNLLYVTCIIYGIGILLIEQTFNYDGYVGNFLLIWIIGLIPYIILFKDKKVLIFSQILMFIYINDNIYLEDMFALVSIIIFFMYAINYYVFSNSNIEMFMNNILIITSLIYFISYIKGISCFTPFILLLLGLSFYYSPFLTNKKVFEIQGNLMIGISGIILTYKENWECIKWVSENTTIVPTAIFSLLFFIYLLFLIKKGSIISLVILCVTIARFYFDIAHALLPKSIFFTLGGIVLLLIGYCLEKARKKEI